MDFPLRAIVGDALRLRARALIVAHNHPSGDPAPSRADLAVTRALADAVRPIGVALLDHLIFAGAEWRSLRALGVL